MVWMMTGSLSPAPFSVHPLQAPLSLLFAAAGSKSAGRSRVSRSKSGSSTGRFSRTPCPASARGDLLPLPCRAFWPAHASPALRETKRTRGIVCLHGGFAMRSGTEWTSGDFSSSAGFGRWCCCGCRRGSSRRRHWASCPARDPGWNLGM